MTFTEEEYRQFETVYEEVKKLIINQSSSNISAELMMLLGELVPKYAPSLCSHCPSGLYMGASRMYHIFLRDMEERQRQVKEEKTVAQTVEKHKINNNKNGKQKK